MSLPGDTASVALARRFVRELLATHDASQYEDEATLLVSELVTNAVLHARSDAKVTVRLDDDRLWVGVSDSNPMAPVPKRYGPDAATGRGLRLVEELASRWGTELSGTGKVVWFELVAGERSGSTADATSEFLEDLAALGFDGPANAGAPEGTSASRVGSGSSGRSSRGGFAARRQPVGAR